MRYKDEFHIASTAVLLSMAMFGISVVVPKESRVPHSQDHFDRSTGNCS